MTSLPLRFLGLLLAGMVAGCSADAKKSRLRQSAERYFEAGEYEKSKIQYLNLLKLDSQDKDAIQRLGLIWFEQGAPIRALPFLAKAKELAPNNVETRLKLAMALIAAGGTAEARKEALAILQESPTNAEAIGLLADTDQTPKDVEYTEQQLQKFPQRDTVAIQLASATVSLRKGDLASAESALQRALALDAKSPWPHLAMGKFSLVQRNPTRAAEEFRTAAELAPVRSRARLQYAEFLTQNRERDKAKAVIEEVTRKAPDFLPGWRLLAQLSLAEGKSDESLKLLEEVFRQDPENLEARLVQAEAWLAKRETAKAVDGLERLNKTYPKVPVIKFYLARAHLQNGNLPQAVAELNQAVATSPDYTEAVLLLSELNLRKGESQPVIAAMADLLKKHPKLAAAQVLLADAYRLSGKIDEATNVIREQVQLSPDNAQSHLRLGVLLRLGGKTDEARDAFEKALSLAPDDTSIAAHLVDLDIQARNFDLAMQRVDRLLEKRPDSAGAHFLKGRIYAVQKSWDSAESELLKALDLKPDLSGAYDVLINVYMAANKLSKAIEHLQSLLAANPNNVRALMLSALIYDKQHEFTKAAEAYERLIAAKVESPPVLNNLAYLYSERLDRLDRALELARKGRTLRPGVDATADPALKLETASVADTLGWILYKRKDFAEALPLLQEAARDLSDNPECQYHLGMASYMMGLEDAARTALRFAASAPSNSLPKDEIQHRLRLLEDETGNRPELTSEELNAVLKQQPDDVVVQMRLGGVYERERDFAKAAANYQRAVDANPKLLEATLRLAHLNAGPLHNLDQSLILAKKARQIAPNDPRATGTLGGIAYQTGDFAWAYSLLQESARSPASDPNILINLGRAAFGLGKVNEAQQVMNRALNANPDAGQAEEARSFLALTTLDSASKDLPTAEAEAEKALQRDPEFLPALMVKGAILRQRGEMGKAAGVYESILTRFPGFVPAQKHLASLYAGEPEHLAKAYDLAAKARKALPDDPEVAATLGEVSYHRKEFDYARQLLQESARQTPLSARSLFYLGMSHWRLNAAPESERVLTQAIAAGLQEPLATEARHVLAEIRKS